MNINNLIFDFDGVILNSDKIRTDAYRYIFSNFDDLVVNKIIEYHQLYTGLSRYEKINYFYNEILIQNVSRETVTELAQRYSNFCLEKINESHLIEPVIEFIKRYSNQLNLHIASGSDDFELKLLVKKFKLNRYFKSVHGSPEIKKIIVKNIIENNDYKLSNTALIGDSIVDYEASKYNDIIFFGFNNKDFKKLEINYLNQMDHLKSYF